MDLEAFQNAFHSTSSQAPYNAPTTQPANQMPANKIATEIRVTDDIQADNKSLNSLDSGIGVSGSPEVAGEGTNSEKDEKGEGVPGKSQRKLKPADFKWNCDNTCDKPLILYKGYAYLTEFVS